MFLRKPAVSRDPLTVTMSGVRLGERVLQIVGSGDARIAGLIAAKSGLTGTAAIIAMDEHAAARAREAAADAGAVADVHLATPSLPFPPDAFDVIVIHHAAQPLGSVMAQRLVECRRVLRDGGRIVAVETTHRRGILRLFRRAPGGEPGESSAAVLTALREAGFASPRVLGERENLRFIEAFRTR